MANPYRRAHTGERLADDAQRLAQSLAREGNAHPFAGALLLDKEETSTIGASGISFTAGTAKSISHGLNRKPNGFLEVYGPDLPSAGHVGLYPTSYPTGQTSDTHLRLTPTTTGICFILVF